MAPNGGAFERGATPDAKLNALGRKAAPCAKLEVPERGAAPDGKLKALGRGAASEANLKALGRDAAPEAELKALDPDAASKAEFNDVGRRAAPDAKLRDLTRKSVTDMSDMSGKRNAADESTHKSEITKYAMAGDPVEIAGCAVQGGEDAQLADGSEIYPGCVRKVYGVGRGAADGSADAAPDNYEWGPTFYGDLLGDERVAAVAAMREFLYGTGEGACGNCTSRWVAKGAAAS